MDETSIRLSVDLDEIDRMNRWLAAHHEGPQEVFERLKLCLNEAVENTIRYGFDNRAGGLVEVSLGQRGGCLEAVVRDDGLAYDPLERALPDPMSDIETASIGGFGVLLMRDAATSLEYEYRDGHNLLTARFCPR